MRNLFRFILTVGLLAGPQAFAHAQTAAYAEIVQIDAGDFPKVSALLDVFDANGNFMRGLAPSNLTVYEDGQTLNVDTITESALPVQVVVAINQGPALAVRDSNGVPRFDHVVQTFSEWVVSQPAESQDDLSLVSLSGSLINHANYNDWFVSFNSFKPDFRNSTPNLQTLSIALDTVSAATPQPGMKRAVLFITPHMDDPNIDNTIAPLIKRAVEAKVRVFVWFIDAEDFSINASSNAFKSLAQQTNGAFFSFSGKESFPDINQYLAPLRYIYGVTYTSALITPGDHTLGFYVDSGQGEIPALNKTFSVDVQPPNPIFVAPPMQITRQPPADDPYNTEVIEPEQQLIEIIVEFPDGHKRGLKRTTLYVDGAVVAENIKEPFNKFMWDLTPYDMSGKHEITAEAEDSLGLKKSTISIPITLTVMHAPRGISAFLARYRQYVVTGAITFAGLALLVILLRGRVRNLPAKKKNMARKSMEDPLTQPVSTLTEPSISATKRLKTQPRFASWIPSRESRVPKAPAYLIRLMNGGEPASVAPIPVVEKDMTFGTDPVQSMYVLDDPSISPLHARIKQTEDGVFIIVDQDSIAGTWVNYEQVTREGHRLTHGDRIHFGQRVYRFDLSQPPAESEPKVIAKK